MELTHQTLKYILWGLLCLPILVIGLKLFFSLLNDLRFVNGKGRKAAERAERERELEEQERRREFDEEYEQKRAAEKRSRKKQAAGRKQE